MSARPSAQSVQWDGTGKKVEVASRISINQVIAIRHRIFALLRRLRVVLRRGFKIPKEGFCALRMSVCV